MMLRQLRFERLDDRLMLSGMPVADALVADATAGEVTHPDDPAKQADHNQLLALVPVTSASHIAIGGDWFDPSSWDNGQVPTDGSDVLIPLGTSVQYAEISDTRLHTIRVDGRLTFATDVSTQLIVDTFIVSSSGYLSIGTKDQPVSPAHTARIIFPSDLPIDTAWDPTLLSRGIISHGTVEIVGAYKRPFDALRDPLYPDDLVLKTENRIAGEWKPGDNVVVTGTSFDPEGHDADNSRFQDEVLTLKALSGRTATFANNDTGGRFSRFDHVAPAGASVYVANLTRNVTFETEGGPSTPPDRRAHAMFMHAPTVRIENAGFYDLGRSDKTILVDDPVLDNDGNLVPGTGTNRRGRYALHFHRNGADDPNAAPAVANNNVIWGSPGWGIVHHDSHVNLKRNVVFDVVGAGIVAEEGHELGTWENNLTIKTTGDESNNQAVDGPRLDLDIFIIDRSRAFDFGFLGEGYWLQGGAPLVRQIDNIAASAAGGGINLFSATDGLSPKQHPDIPFAIKTELLPPELQIIAGGDDEVPLNAIPHVEFRGMQVYNSSRGIIMWGHKRPNPSQQPTGVFVFGGRYHDVETVVEDFRLWGLFKSGIRTHYTSLVTFRNGLVLSSTDSPTDVSMNSGRDDQGWGFFGNKNPTIRYKFENVHFEGWGRAIMVPEVQRYDDSDRTEPAKFIASHVWNSSFSNNLRDFSRAGNSKFPEYFEIVDTVFETITPNITPLAAFSTSTPGGPVVRLNATSSVDPDAHNDGNGIAAYSWDFDRDGIPDDFGSVVDFQPQDAALVTLTVFDDRGATAATSLMIQPVAAAYTSAFVDSTPTETRKNFAIANGHSGRGWYLNADGPLAQVVRNNYLHRGQQEFTFDLIAGGVAVRIWGVNGEFKKRTRFSCGPVSVNQTSPMQSTLLYDATEQQLGRHRADVDLADGYEYLLVQFIPLGTMNVSGVFLGTHQ